MHPMYSLFDVKMLEVCFHSQQRDQPPFYFRYTNLFHFRELQITDAGRRVP
jgi:hypothetical protein